MEVQLDKRYPVAATVDQAWAVLANIRATAACMPGAQITEQLDDTHFKGIVKSKVGPASLLFNGDIELQGLDQATAGKLAQFGSRLLVPVADAMLAQFADNFRAAALAVPPADESTEIRMVQGGEAPGAMPEPVAEPRAASTPPAAAPVQELNALALMWTVLKGWLAGLFGKRS
jgi:uncharacterized protein